LIKKGDLCVKVLDVKGINMNFFTEDGELEVLDNISFTVNKGEIVAIVGPSGSGKTTILNVIAKLLTPVSGEVEINGEIGYMFQRDHLLEWRTIWHNLLIGLEIKHQKTPQQCEKVENMLRKYQLYDFRNRYPKELSGGMRQRIALIRTLAIDPEVLLLDEPFSSLDYQTRLMVSDDVYKMIKNENIAAILVTHDISEAISMADKIIVLTQRPASIKNIHKIKLTIEGEKTPLKARTAKEFREYFDIIWKELNDNEKKHY
jgi:NitT/TauT family transport system ATP-binding protein